MSTKIDQVVFQIGTVQARNFSEDCQPGDWETFDIPFTPPFPTDRVRVIATANNLGVDRGAHNAAVVAIAQKVTPTGFVLQARNSDCARGFAGFNWMAVAETPGTQQRLINLRLGVVQPRYFKDDCHTGDWQTWGVTFNTLPEVPVTLLTACNLNVFSLLAAAVGIAQDPANSGFTLAARNSGWEGSCAFYYLALTPQGARSDLFVDSGEVFAQSFLAGDTQTWEVQFSESFLTPPVVVVTANDRGVKDSHNAAAVGIAAYVTTHGFTLIARNSDCADGQAGFFWVAIGCAKGCG